LAFILRVNPTTARPRIEEAVSARGKEFSACNHELFQSIAEIHYDPVLEEIGIRSLDDSDPQIAMTAATMLGKHGSPAAEPALWQRYATWGASWAGRESELDVTFAESDNRLDQLGLGQNLNPCEAAIRLCRITGQVPLELAIKLDVQSSRRHDLWQGCHQIAKKSSKIVPSDAPPKFLIINGLSVLCAPLSKAGNDLV